MLSLRNLERFIAARRLSAHYLMIIGTAVSKPIHCGRADEKSTREWSTRYSASAGRQLPFTTFPKTGKKNEYLARRQTMTAPLNNSY